MANGPIGFASTRLAFGYESTYGTASSNIDKTFGQGQELSGYQMNNNNEFVYSLGNQDSTGSSVKDFTGTFSVSSILSDPGFLKAILGGPATTTGSGPYTHAFTTANNGITTSTSGMTINVGYDYSTTDSDQQLLGCVANTFSLNAAVGEMVKIKLDGEFANITKDSTLISNIAPIEDPMPFVMASLEFPNLTTPADVQSVELNWNRNVQMVKKIGSRFASAHGEKQREWNMRVTAMFENDTDFLDDFLGGTGGAVAAPAETATSTLTITNGLSSTNTRSYTFGFANLRVNTIGLPITVGELVKQELEIRARSCSGVTVINNSSSFPSA